MNQESRIKNQDWRKKSASSYRDSRFLIRDFVAPRRRGFTLVEMLVSISLFSFIMLATTAVLLSVVDANHKAQGLKTTVDNLSLAVESMTRNLRTGSSFTPLAGASSCGGTGVTGIQFKDHLGVVTQYWFDGGAVKVSKDLGQTFIPITAPEIAMDRLCFYIGGIAPSDAVQPNVLMTLGGIVSPTTVVGAKPRTTSRFDLQAFITQRIPDVAS